MHAVAQQLHDLIVRNKWEQKFDQAIEKARSYDIYKYPKFKDWEGYVRWVDALAEWAPRQHKDSRWVYQKIVEFYFVLDQEPVKSLQNKIKPGKKPQRLTKLSQWIVDFANSWGAYLDSEDSAKLVKTFKDDRAFNWDQYMPPPSNYPPREDWKAYRTFNQFFARHLKPGKRPIAGLCDHRVVVSPADCTFVGWWQIDESSRIYVEDEVSVVDEKLDHDPVQKLDIKGLYWSIEQLLEGSEYADAFRGGIFTHSFLNTTDYHRWHTPVEGIVIEARVIQGQAYLDVTTKPAVVDGQEVTMLNALDGTGYQFVQTRGLVVMDSPIGLVACLPMGMAQVSSVIITAEVGATLHKGEELGYFQFGGSDFVMVFERSSNIQLTGQPGVHYNMGSAAGTAHPYTLR